MSNHCCGLIKEVLNLNNIVNLWEKSVKKFPNSIAVESENQKYTYEELEKLSDKYAYALSKYKKKETNYLLFIAISL